MLWLAEFGGMDGPGFRFLVCAPPRRVYVRNPRTALLGTSPGSCDEGLGMLVAELIPEPGASPGTPVLASVALDSGRTIRVQLDWCADATNVAPRRILRAATLNRAGAQAGEARGG
jgi:hypothetical protein